MLQHATGASLLLLDELGRGTSTHDGYAIAYAVLCTIAHDTRARFQIQYPRLYTLDHLNSHHSISCDFMLWSPANTLLC